MVLANAFPGNGLQLQFLILPHFDNEDRPLCIFALHAAVTVSCMADWLPEWQR